MKTESVENIVAVIAGLIEKSELVPSLLEEVNKFKSDSKMELLDILKQIITKHFAPIEAELLTQMLNAGWNRDEIGDTMEAFKAGFLSQKKRANTLRGDIVVKVENGTYFLTTCYPGLSQKAKRFFLDTETRQLILVCELPNFYEIYAGSGDILTFVDEIDKGKVKSLGRGIRLSSIGGTVGIGHSTVLFHIDLFEDDLCEYYVCSGNSHRKREVQLLPFLVNEVTVDMIGNGLSALD